METLPRPPNLIPGTNSVLCFQKRKRKQPRHHKRWESVSREELSSGYETALGKHRPREITAEVVACFEKTKPGYEAGRTDTAGKNINALVPSIYITSNTTLRTIKQEKHKPMLVLYRACASSAGEATNGNASGNRSYK